MFGVRGAAPSALDRLRLVAWPTAAIIGAPALRTTAVELIARPDLSGTSGLSAHRRQSYAELPLP